MIKEKQNQVPVTVLMTVYHEEQYLAEAIESILGQTFKTFEFLIICEYGADEGTRTILDRYAKRDPRIVIVQNTKRLGFAASLNRGIRLARGRYIARMDSDDVSVPNRLKWQSAYMEKHPELVVSGGSIRYLQGDRLTRYTQRYLRTAKQIRMSMLFLCGFSHPAVMINKELLQRYGYTYNEQIKTEDYELWSRLVYQHPTANMRRTLLYYRLHDNNSIKTQRDAVAESTRLVQEKILNRYGIDIRLKNQILEGAYDEQQLEELEHALHVLLRDNPQLFDDKFVFRNRMDVVYRNTERNMGVSLHKIRRYWDRFGELYGKNQYVLRKMDWGIYTVKDILWIIWRIRG